MNPSFTYTIKAFDTTAKTLDVTFDDGTWARIQLRDPLPATMNELDMLVRQYTASVEAATARSDTTADLGFITAAVGQDRAAARFSVKQGLDGDPQVVQFPPAPVTLDDWKAYMKAQVAAARYQKEIAGVAIADGKIVSTDRDSQSKITAKFLAIQAGATGSIQWKLTDGTFTTFTAQQFMALAQQAAAQVQAAFDWESTKVAQIDAATTIPEVQAAKP